ncbi:MAG TPA: hypothetical protein VGA47_13810 [Candidatus Dormibacteraeota bacterium]
MAYLVAGPLVALVGIVAVFFVLRRKSVEKRSMYSARRTQIEHKVRAARQRTLVGRGRSERRAPPPTEAPSPFAGTQVQPTVTYEAPAYQPPPVAPPSVAPESQWGQPAAAPSPWDTTTSAPAPAESPAAPPEPAWTPPPPASEPFRPAAEPTPMAPSEPAWTPAPAPAAEPVAHLEPAASSSSSTAAGSWSVVSTSKDSSAGEETGGQKRGKAGAATGAWELASGEAPGMDSEEAELKRPSGSLMAIAQYLVLVVGLVMVLIGVLVMVANSKVT